MKTVIIDNNGREVSESSAIMAYFGRKEGQSLQGFMAEVKELSPESKRELALGSVKELNWTLRDSE